MTTMTITTPTTTMTITTPMTTMTINNGNENGQCWLFSTLVVFYVDF